MRTRLCDLATRCLRSHQARRQPGGGPRRSGGVDGTALLKPQAGLDSFKTMSVGTTCDQGTGAPPMSGAGYTSASGPGRTSPAAILQALFLICARRCFVRPGWWSSKKSPSSFLEDPSARKRIASFRGSPRLPLPPLDIVELVEAGGRGAGKKGWKRGFLALLQLSKNACGREQMMIMWNQRMLRMNILRMRIGFGMVSGHVKHVILYAGWPADT